jgi:hypothetical protein
LDSLSTPANPSTTIKVLFFRLLSHQATKALYT